MPRDRVGLNDIHGVSLYAREEVLGAQGLRLLESDELGALDVNTYAPIVRRRIPFSQDSSAYATGTVIGAPSNPPIINTVSRANGHGGVIETLTVRLLGIETTPPDLDFYFFSRLVEGTSTFANHGYPSIDQNDMLSLAAVISVRSAAGHWMQLKSGASAVLGHVATLIPFVSFVLNNNTDPNSASINFFAVNAGSSYTFDVNSILDCEMAIRQG